MKKARLSSVVDDRLCVVLVAVRNPLNIGAVARAMSNFGFHRLRIVNPYDLPFREAQSAVGAATLLREAQECKKLADAVFDCQLVVGTTSARHRALQHPLHPLQAGARLIRNKLQFGRVALLFGSEKRGLSNDDLSHCHWLMRIPTEEQNPSMNLGQAVAVCLYEVAREMRMRVKAEKPQAGSSADLERVTALLCDALRVSGYMKPNAAPASKLHIRKLVHRLNLSSEDANVCLGMLRQMLWKMQEGN